MKPSGPLKRTGWLKRGKRLKPFGKRAKRDRETGRVFGSLCDFVREMPCVICGLRPVEPHHVRSRGAGHGDWLTGGDGNVVPVCRSCHQNIHAGRSLDTAVLRWYAKKVGESFLRETGGSDGG